MDRLALKRKALPLYAILLGLCLALFPRGAPAAMEGYCQYPPYVRQSVLPSVTLLVSNSVSMLQFAYGDDLLPTNPCDDPLTACGGFDPATRYYGLFDSDYWYSYSSSAGGGFVQGNEAGGTLDAPTGRGPNDWHGNFLNWLTTRRVDVLRKVLTGGTGDGTQLCGSGTAEWKKFTDTQVYTPVSATDQIVRFPKSTNCTGTLLGFFEVGSKSYNVRNRSAGTTSGIIQEMTPKASLGLAFYNSSDSQGAEVNPQIDGGNLPISAYRNRIDTPSNFNGITVGAPLGEALWTIVGSYMRHSASDSTNGPRYHNADYVPTKDPYTFHGGPSRCVKGSVIVISDGEPCNDGNLPTSYSGFNIRDFAFGTALDCEAGICLAAPTFGFPSLTTIPSCAAGGAAAGLEDVALFAHTQDLRSSPTIGTDNLANRQNLDVYVIRAFGSDTSNLLKYAAINGTFDDQNGNGKPDPGEYSLSTAYAEADDGFAISRALRDIFENLLRRATSGTAASVLASGQGSGANLVQAVFYPRRRFFDEVIEWTGTLQNFWYYVDPFLGNSSIREETQRDADVLAGVPHTLNLVSDKTLSFFFDTTSGTTRANRYSNDSTTGNATGTATEIPFEQAMSIWEAGTFLHLQDPLDREIYTVTDNNYGTVLIAGGNAFVTSRASSLSAFLGADNTAHAEDIIRYVRGDDLAGFRQRTVPYPTNTATDNTVWKLGDIINSTPRVVASIPLNTYQKTYNDLTYDAFTKTDTYKNRGMVFVGANDGMLHAFKLGKLEFPGDAGWSSPGTWDKARLRNLDSSNGALGVERWAFIPKNALPYLQALGDNTYCHLYYVDLAPQVFDASINGADNAVRTASSWRTILVGGMRLGGGCASPGSGRANAVDIPISGVGYSSYFAIDVTNPEAPKVLWEFSHPSLGFATTGPAIVRMNAGNASGNPDRTLNGKWYVVFGSGPTGPISDRQFLARSDQALKLFVVDLKTGALATTPIDQFPGSTISNAFAGSILNSTADVDLDYQDDVLYFGYVKENSGSQSGNWNQGGVARLQMNGSSDPNDWSASKVLDNIGPVTSSVARLQNNILHTNWLFFGTGRYFYASPSTQDDPTIGRTLYGVKDRCFNSMNTMTPNCTLVVDPPAIDAETPPSDEPAGGWFINLDTDEFADYDGTGEDLQYDAERVITDPLATSSGVVFFTSYRPYGEDCSIGGRTFLWAVQYNTGGAPAIALQGKVLMQVSTASVEQVDLSTAFSGAGSRGGRRSYSLEGVPPMAQGLSLLSPPPPVKRILHIRER